MEIMMKIVYGGYDKDSNDRKKLQTAYYIHFTYPINSIQLSQVNKTISQFTVNGSGNGHL